MKLTQKLLKHIHQVFDKGAAEFLAFRLQYDGAMTWTIADNWLTTTIVGGSGTPLKLDLSLYTVAALAAYIAIRPGYSIVYQDASSLSRLSASVLIDGTGDPSTSNGDHVTGYTSLLWWYLESTSIELVAASVQITEMLKQMSISVSTGTLYDSWIGLSSELLFTSQMIPPSDGAADYWLDEQGSYYNVLRNPGESDYEYGPRIISEVLRPRGNNRAIEMAIKAATGVSAMVRDIGVQTFAGGVTCAGLFDVLYAAGSEIDDTVFAARVRAVVESMRDAGTFMRSLRLYLVYDGVHTYNNTILHNATPL